MLHVLLGSIKIRRPKLHWATLRGLQRQPQGPRRGAPDRPDCILSAALLVVAWRAAGDERGGEERGCKARKGCGTRRAAGCTRPGFSRAGACSLCATKPNPT